MAARFATLIGCLGVLVLVAASGMPASASSSKEPCGTAEKFGHQFEVRVGGKPVGCPRAARIIDRPCRVRQKHEWSCFSFRERFPFIVWFPTKELFEPDWSTVIIYKRYPCSEATLSREEFFPTPRGFPTLRQLLADDILRCGLLEGTTYDEVRALLGPPMFGERGKRLSYDIGPQRDSFFQIDSEILSIGFRKNGIFSGAAIYQG